MNHSGWKNLNRANSQVLAYLRKILFVILPVSGFFFSLPEAALTNEIKEESGNRGIRGEVSTSPDHLECDELVSFTKYNKAVIPKEKHRDRQIEQNILEEIKSDPFIKSKDFEVIVKNGVATLEGTVNNLTEHAAATADAFQGGAREVRNNLKIRVKSAKSAEVTI